MKLSDKIQNALCEKSINERKYFESPDILPVIKELGQTQWSKGKRRQLKACNLFTQIAESDENISNTFMREVDKATTQVAEKIIKKVEENFFKVKKHKKI